MTSTVQRGTEAEEILAPVEETCGFPPKLMEEMVAAPAAARMYVAARDALSGASSSEAQTALAAEGVDRGRLFEIVGFVAVKTLSNYVNHIAGTELDPRFS